MDKNLLEELKKEIKGEILEDEQTLKNFSHDASIFEVRPRAVIFPKGYDDVKSVVAFVAKHKKNYPYLSVTGRSAGTDMGGGSLSESIILSFTQHLNNIIGIEGNIATTEPGVYYRDFEKFTLKHGLIFPSYPASKELCAMGGIVNNNSGGKNHSNTERPKILLRN